MKTIIIAAAIAALSATTATAEPARVLTPSAYEAMPPAARTLIVSVSFKGSATVRTCKTWGQMNRDWLGASGPFRDSVWELWKKNCA